MKTILILSLLTRLAFSAEILTTRREAGAVTYPATTIISSAIFETDASGNVVLTPKSGYLTTATAAATYAPLVSPVFSDDVETDGQFVGSGAGLYSIPASSIEGGIARARINAALAADPAPGLFSSLQVWGAGTINGGGSLTINSGGSFTSNAGSTISLGNQPDWRNALGLGSTSSVTFTEVRLGSSGPYIGASGGTDRFAVRATNNSTVHFSLDPSNGQALFNFTSMPKGLCFSSAPQTTTPDVNISRISAGLLGIGTGNTAGGTGGAISLANITASANVATALVAGPSTGDLLVGGRTSNTFGPVNFGSSGAPSITLQRNTISIGLRASSVLAWCSTENALGTIDSTISRKTTEPGTFLFGLGATANSLGSAELTNLTTSGTVRGTEQTSAPAAPPANGYSLYAEDNGSGKTRLMVRFASGAAQQIAIEP